MENSIINKEKIRKQDLIIMSLIKFFNNFIEKNFPKFSISIKQNDFKYLIYFLELNVKLLSTNKIKYIISIEHTIIISESNKEFKENLFKFLLFFIFLINIHNKSFNFFLNLNKYESIQAYASLIRKLYQENLFDADSFLKFLKFMVSLSLFTFDTNNILNNTNSQQINNLYRNFKTLYESKKVSKLKKNEGINFISLFIECFLFMIFIIYVVSCFKSNIRSNE